MYITPHNGNSVSYKQSNSLLVVIYNVIGPETKREEKKWSKSLLVSPAIFRLTSNWKNSFVLLILNK